MAATDIPLGSAVKLRASINDLLTKALAAAKTASDAATLVSGSTTLAAQASAEAADAKADAAELGHRGGFARRDGSSRRNHGQPTASAAAGSSTQANNSRTAAAGSEAAAAGSAANAATSATGASAAATSAAATATAFNASKGTAGGIAALDGNGRVPLGQLQIRTSQVLIATKAAFALITGASFSGFLAAQGGPDATDGSWEAIYAEAFAPVSGGLYSALNTYLISLGLSSDAALTQLNTIWAAAGAGSGSSSVTQSSTGAALQVSLFLQAFNG